MYKKILETVTSYHMIKPGEHILAAVSGGADSVCLLCVLNSLKKDIPMTLEAVHVHHGLRGREADRDMEYVKSLCHELNVPLTVEMRDAAEYAKAHHLSLEEGGRVLRYEIFRQVAEEKGCEKIAVAHHLDDQAETVLHHLVRGSGLKGLRGIPFVRGNIIRPLLEVSRQEILSYLHQEGIGYCEDSTNAENDYTRNRLRNLVLRVLKEQVNAQAAENISHMAVLAGEADEYIRQQAAGIWQVEGQEKAAPGGQIFLVSREVLKEQPPIIQSYLIRHMISGLSGCEKDITYTHVKLVQQLLEKESGKRLSLPYELTAGIDGAFLWIKQGKLMDPVEEAGENTLPNPEFRVFSYEKHMKIPENQYTKWFDYDKIKDTVSVRYRETGDYFTLPGGGRKSVKTYMIDQKIPREMRGRIPLLAEGSHVLWVMGYRISEYYKVTEDTKTILQVQTNGGKEHG